MRAIIPVRSLTAGKTRLARELDLVARRSLIQEMAIHVIGTLRRAGVLESVAVLSPDSEVLSLARLQGVAALAETAAADLNDALEQVRQEQFCREADALLFIFADLPALAAEEVREMAELAQKRQAPLIAPDRHGAGTNALLLRQGEQFRFQFGPDSFHRHVAQAVEAGQSPHIYRAWGTAFDLDAGEDLRLWRKSKMELWRAIA